MLCSGGQQRVPAIVEQPAARPSSDSSGVRRAPKLIHLQILRACAASLVVVDHTFGSLDFRKLPFSQYQHAGDLSGNMGVCAFFVLSGLIMMRQSANRFGTLRGPFTFLRHRLIRIVPMYWIATILWFAELVTDKVWTPHAKGQMLLSLGFIPNYLAGDFRLMPVLQAGWTLNYEMSFYALFALALFLPRKTGLTVLMGVPLVLYGIGHRHHGFLLTQGAPSVLRVYTDSIILLFAVGVVIGFAESGLKHLPKLKLAISPAFLIVLPPLLFLCFPTTWGAMDWWAEVRVYSIVVVSLCAIVGNERVGWVNRTLVLLGDASYSTYLFHLWACGWTIPLVLWIDRHLQLSASSPVPFVVASLVAANALGAAIHLAVERPLTQQLKRIRFGRTGYAAGSATLLPASSTSKLST
jgi:exopolysaccharide production protein ExoZ